jgi:tetratricopeptide (TPR) repeat protein
MADEPRQYWIRNETGTVWGPLTFATIELLVENKAMLGRLQASEDGLNFAFPGRFESLRDAFPRELWGIDGAAAPAAVTPVAHAPDAAAPPVVSPPAGRAKQGPPVLTRGGGPPKLSPVTPGAVPSPPPPIASAPPSEVAPKPSIPVSPVVPAPAVEPRRPVPTPAIPAATQPSEIPPSGTLADFSPIRLYALIAVEGVTGKLSLQVPTLTYEVFFKKGAPEAARSDATADDIGTYLERQKIVDAKAIQDATAVASNYGGDLVAALFALKLINPNDAFKHLTDHALGVLRRALTAESGTFQFEPNAPMPATTFPLGNRWGLLCDAVRKLAGPEIRRRMGLNADRPVMKSGGLVRIEDLKLNAQEVRATTHFEGVRSPNELAAAMPTDAEHFYRLAFLLTEIDLMSFAQVRPKVGPKEAVAPKPGPTLAAAKPAAAPTPPAPSAARAPTTTIAPKPVAPVAAKPAAPTRPAAPVADRAPASVPMALPKAAQAFVARAMEIGDDVAKLAAVRDELKKKDHFEALGLTKDAQPSDLKATYFALAKCFHPDSVQTSSPPQAAQIKSELFARISEAWGVVGDDKLRNAYLDELQYGSEKVDVAAVFAAEESFQKACILVKVRKYEDALKMFEEAIKLNDKEGEFYAWRGYTQFLVSKDRAATKTPALAEIDKALKMNPRCAQAHYLAGQIFKVLNDIPSAEKRFNQALSIDPLHKDAQSEIRLMKMRK